MREEDGQVQQKTQLSSTAVYSILEWLECARLQFKTAVCRIQEMAKERPGYMLALLFASCLFAALTRGPKGSAAAKGIVVSGLAPGLDVPSADCICVTCHYVFR